MVNQMIWGVGILAMFALYYVLMDPIIQEEYECDIPFDDNWSTGTLPLYEVYVEPPPPAYTLHSSHIPMVQTSSSLPISTS